MPGLTRQDARHPPGLVVGRADTQSVTIGVECHKGTAEYGIHVIWPFALGYFQDSRIVAAWCEHRGDFRHFRPERIESMAVLDERYPQHRLQLLKTWRGQQKDVRYLPDA